MKNKIKGIAKDIVITLLFLVMATLLGLLFSHLKWQETNIVVTYILSIILIARFTTGYVYGIVATISSLLLFNWFFTDPYFTLNVKDPTYFVTFLIMCFTSILTSMLTSKVKKAAISAEKKQKENHALYQMTNLFTDANNPEKIASITASTVSKIMSCDTAVALYNENESLERTFIQQKGNEQIRRELANGEELEKRIANLHTSCDIDDEYCNYPVYGSSGPLAIMRIPKEVAGEMSEEQSRMIFAIIENTALALERLRSIKAHEKSRDEAIQEHYRGNLLRSISHDIRTPLSGIMGSAEMLMDMTDKSDPKFNIETGIYQDADWLHSLVENILNLTKLQDGKLNLNKQTEVVEEVVGSAVTLIEKRYPGVNISVSCPDDFIMVDMDAKLICQVLVNLLDNAVKHTPKNKEIEVKTKVIDGAVQFSVLDNGSGIKEKDLPKIFEMFYTTWRKSSDSQRGVGLGLAICQSIVEAHGGVITAENRVAGGAKFTFTLPSGEKKND